MDWWPRVNLKSLKIRLTAWYLLLFGFSVFSRNLYIYAESRSSLVARLDSTLEVALTTIAENSLDADGRIRKERSTADFLRYFNKIGYSLRLLEANGKISYEDGNFSGFPLRVPLETGYLTQPCGAGFCRVYTRLLGENRGWLQVSRDLDSLARPAEQLLFSLWESAVLVLLLAGVGGLFVIDRTLRPLDQVIQTAEAIHPDDISRRVHYPDTTDDIGRLAAAIDRMLDRLQFAFEREKRFTADVSHELRTPLSAIKGRIGVTLGRARGQEEYTEALGEIEGEIDRLIRLANGLLFIARLEQETLETKAVDISELLEILVEQLRGPIEEGGKTIATDIESSLVVAGNGDYLISLFLNLLDNAMKYTPTGGKIHLSAGRSGDRIQVAIRNTGEGISPESVAHLFERFYRVENARSRQTGGAGLGLAIVQEIVRLHGGSIAAVSQPGQETVFTVSLPLRRDQSTLSA
jgi:heavy metal sensor kinase